MSKVHISQVPIKGELVFGKIAITITVEFAENDGDDSDHGLDFSPFKEFYPRQEYENDANQLAFRYSLSVQEYKRSHSRRELKFDAEEAAVKTLKVKKIKVIANFAAVERLMLFAFNAMHDLANVDAEYKAHIELGKMSENIKKQYLGQPTESENTARTNREPPGLA